MRVLIAFDGSNGAEQALSLAGAVRWPEGSILRLVAVADYVAMPAIGRGAPLPSPELETEILGYFDDVVEDAVKRLRASSQVEVEGSVLRGRPGTAIVAEASRFGADLVVGGSRGHGAIASLVLGSVSSEFVDHAPCPALVVRTPTISRVLFASDGSDSAAVAESLLAEWPLFQALPIEVLSVGDVAAPWRTGIAPAMYAHVIAAHTKDVAEAKAAHQALAEEAATRLRDAGRTVTARARTGDAAHEIIDEATQTGADLIVLGSRGRTGMKRLLLGSVARNVVHASAASVLIVRQPDAAVGAPGR